MGILLQLCKKLGEVWCYMHAENFVVKQELLENLTFFLYILVNQKLPKVSKWIDESKVTYVVNVSKPCLQWDITIVCCLFFSSSFLGVWVSYNLCTIWLFFFCCWELSLCINSQWEKRKRKESFVMCLSNLLVTHGHPVVRYDLSVCWDQFSLILLCTFTLSGFNIILPLYHLFVYVYDVYPAFWNVYFWSSQGHAPWGRLWSLGVLLRRSPFRIFMLGMVAWNIYRYTKSSQ